MKAYISRGANNQYHFTMENPYNETFKQILISKSRKTDNMRISKEFVDALGITLGKNEYIEVEISKKDNENNQSERPRVKK